MAATGGVQPLSWSISSGNLPAGLTLSGACTISGTPTGAPGTAKFTVTVSDAENPTAKATADLSIVVNSATTALFKGNYAFLFSGYFNGYFTGVGSFVADGAGNITGGIVDTNGLTGPTINGGFTGTYSIGSNSMGTMNWIFTGPGGGTSIYAVVLSSDGNARFIQYDSRGVQGAGVIKKQDSTAFSAGKIKGNYALGLAGIDGPQTKRMALVGEFQSDGVSQLSNAMADDNDNGSLLSKAGLTGNFSVASTGRGTVALNVSGLGILNASFYVISANEFFLMETDTVGAGHPLLSGDVLEQNGAGSFTDASLNTSSVLEADGLASSNPATSSATLGLAVVSVPGTLNVSSDVDSGGVLSTSEEQLTYSVAFDGRVDVTGNDPAILYLVNTNQAFALFSDTMVTFGVLEPQAAGPFTNASLSGKYEGSSITLADAGSTEADQLAADGNGNLTETFNSSDGTHLQQGTRSLDYLTATNGRTVVSTAQNSTAGIIYVVSPERAIELGAGSPSLNIFEHWVDLGSARNLTDTEVSVPLERVLRCVCLSFLIAIALAMVGCGGSHVPAQTSSLDQVVDAVAQAAMQQQGIPGMTVALAKNGAMLYVHGFGVSDLTTQRPAATGAIFEIGSITKQFTAALIMKLQEQGKLHIDDSIAVYLPQYNFPTPITLRMMLSHTSGLADFTNFPQLGDWLRNGVSEATVLTAVSQSPLQFQPGTQYSYSNSNFFALGAVIEKLTGQSYATSLEQSVFQPLGLKNTYYELPPASQSASGYTNNGAGLVSAIIWDRSAAFAAGALSSNVYDLVAWDNALISGKVVSPASFEAMTTSNGFQIPGGGSYGFGLALWTFNNKPIIWHNGQIGGYTAETAVFLGSGFSVVVLTNDQDADPDAVVLGIMNAVCNSTQLAGNC